MLLTLCFCTAREREREREREDRKGRDTGPEEKFLKPEAPSDRAVFTPLRLLSDTGWILPIHKKVAS